MSIKTIGDLKEFIKDLPDGKLLETTTMYRQFVGSGKEYNTFSEQCKDFRQALKYSGLDVNSVEKALNSYIKSKYLFHSVTAIILGE